MREILFRGKKLYDGSWEYGFLSWSDTPRGRSYFVNNNIVEPETVGQFTGMTDKNGTKIFERDIVVNKNIHGKKWIVEYRTDSEYVGFVLKEIGTNGISLFTSWNDIEVIGNIHDNKELLK